MTFTAAVWFVVRAAAGVALLLFGCAGGSGFLGAIVKHRELARSAKLFTAGGCALFLTMAIVGASIILYLATQ